MNTKGIFDANGYVAWVNLVTKRVMKVFPAKKDDRYFVSANSKFVFSENIEALAAKCQAEGYGNLP